MMKFSVAAGGRSHVQAMSIALVACLGLAACSPKDGRAAGSGPIETPATSMTAAEASSVMAGQPDALDLGVYTGTWTGPEGTSMVIAPKDEAVAVTITNLDGPLTFAGVVTPEGIKFERDGKHLTIHPGNGDDTGMKWLAGKSDCLVVDANEGYCRD